jgi:hypothetical protein
MKTTPQFPHEIITPAWAYEVASHWGSFMSSGDVGACFYSFHPKDARPIDEAHRAACIRYTFTLIECGVSRPSMIELARLGSFFCATPLYGAPVAPPAHRYTFDRLDPDNCRVYYRREDRRLFCIYMESRDKAGVPHFVFMPCSQDGEPSHKIDMPDALAFDRLVFPS